MSETTGPVLGAIARPQLPPERIRSVALAAEEAGLDELWPWEDSFFEGGVSMSAAVLGMTSRLRVGIGVLPFPLRNVALAAMEIAALDRMFPGRFIAGLGHGVQAWMAQAGVRPRSVLTLEREYVAALRALLAGETVSASGEYVRLDGVRLEWPPAAAPALHLAATGPRSLELSGEIGDGTIFSETTIESFSAARRLVLAGRDAAPRAGEHASSRSSSRREPTTPGGRRRRSSPGPMPGRTGSCSSRAQTRPTPRASCASSRARSRRGSRPDGVPRPRREAPAV